MNVTKADYEDDVRMKGNNYIDQAPSTQLIRGTAALISGLCLFFIFLVVVVMSPDPNHEINYKLFLGVECILLALAGYGAWKLDKLDKFLKLCERTTEVWESKKNSQEETN